MTEQLSQPEAFQQESEALRIAEFMDSLGRIGLSKTLGYEFDIYTESSPVKSAISRFKAFDYEPTATGLYLEPEVAEIIVKPENFVTLIARGRHTAHGVFFGSLKDATGEEIEVAVKPYRFDDVLPTCLRDYFSNAAIAKASFDTLRPAGLLLDENRAYSLTILEETLTTLDTIDWEGFSSNIELNPGMQELWAHIARTVAVLHSVGSMMHGDLAARNIGTTSEGNVLLIDWEKANVSLAAPRDTEIKYGYTHTDLYALLESMCRPTFDDYKAGIGLFSGENEDWWKTFEQIFYDEYVEYRLALAKIGRHHAAQLARTEEEIAQLTTSLKEDIDHFQRYLVDTHKV